MEVHTHHALFVDLQCVRFIFHQVRLEEFVSVRPLLFFGEVALEIKQSFLLYFATVQVFRILCKSAGIFFANDGLELVYDILGRNNVLAALDLFLGFRGADLVKHRLR